MFMGNFRDDGRGDRGSRGFGGDRGSRGFGGGRSSGGRGFSGGRGGFGGRPEMHDATCGKCNKSCQVPFRPSGDRPVLCSDCFRQQGSSQGSSSFNSFRERPSHASPGTGVSQAQFKELNAKVDKILEILKNVEFEDDGEDSEDDEEELDEEPAEDEAEDEGIPGKAKVDFEDEDDDLDDEDSEDDEESDEEPAEEAKADLEDKPEEASKKEN